MGTLRLEGKGNCESTQTRKFQPEIKFDLQHQKLAYIFIYVEVNFSKPNQIQKQKKKKRDKI